MPKGGYYVTCPDCGRKIYTINGDWDCGCNSDNTNVDDDYNNEDDDRSDKGDGGFYVTCPNCEDKLYIKMER